MAAQDGSTLRIDFVGANPTDPAGVQRLPGNSNYLIGSDPERWRAAILNYKKVRYSNAYPGVDLVWHGRGGEVEHDFLVAAGADPSRIRLRLSGETPNLDSKGNVAAGKFRFHKPRA